MEEDGWQSKDNHLPDLWTTITLFASAHEAMTLYQRFQTEVEEDISNRFKMLDISNRFKIWDFKSILNVDLWLHSFNLFKSSESYNDTKYSVQVFMKRCHCIKGDLWFQTEVEEGNSKLWRTPLKNGGGRESSWGRPDLGPQDDQGGEPWSWQQHHGSLCWGIWSNKEKSMSTVPLPNWWLDSR